MTEKYWYLKDCDLFQRLTTDQLRQLESQCRLRKLAPKTPIYLPADRADGVLLMASGRAKICSFTPDGKQSILAFVEAGEMFGELALIQSGQREEYAETVVASKVIYIPAEVMQPLLETCPGAAMGVTRLVGLRCRRIERRLKYLLFHSNRERLIHLLLELAEQYGRPTADGIGLRIKLSHQDLASIVGSTRETVTVTLGQLQSEGLVRVGRRKIVLRDVDRLSHSVHGPVPWPGKSGCDGTPSSSGGGRKENRTMFRC